VTTGISSGGQTQITSGLTRGELVVETIPTQATGTQSTNAGTRTGTGGGGFGGGGGFVPGGGGGFGGGRGG
jgi:hypothetical protein